MKTITGAGSAKFRFPGTRDINQPIVVNYCGKTFILGWYDRKVSLRMLRITAGCISLIPSDVGAWCVWRDARVILVNCLFRHPHPRYSSPLLYPVLVSHTTRAPTSSLLSLSFTPGLCFILYLIYAVRIPSKRISLSVPLSVACMRVFVFCTTHRKAYNNETV